MKIGKTSYVPANVVAAGKEAFVKNETSKKQYPRTKEQAAEIYDKIKAQHKADQDAAKG